MSCADVRTGSRLTSLMAAALLAFTAASAAAPAPAPTVDAIVADFIAARGGLTKIKAIQTLRQTGHVYGGAGREALVMRELKRPGKIRFEFTVQGVTAAYVTNGAEGWQVSPFIGELEPKPMPEDAVTEAMEQGDLEGPLVDWKAKGHQVELAGREVVGGRDAHKLKLTLKSGAVRYEYIDVKSHRQVRTDSTRQFRGQAVELTTTFGEHKRAGGVLFPGVIEVAAAGRPGTLRVVVDKIEVNPPIADARFERTTPPK